MLPGALTGADLVVQASRRFAEAGVPEALRDARRLFAHAADVAPGRLTLVLPEPVDGELADTFEGLVLRRLRREPVSHILGRRSFYGREFIVTPDVLDPRPETETLVEVALAEPFGTVLDLGTGSGCILLTLLAENPNCTGQGTDLSPEAVEVARRNAEALDLGERATILVSDWAAQVTAGFDLIVSNPPYVAEAEMADLAPEVRDWEPRAALTDEGDGLSAYREIALTAPDLLHPGGRLLVEIGPSQAEEVSRMFREAGLDAVTTISDMDGRDRVVAARAPRGEEMPF